MLSQQAQFHNTAKPNDSHHALPSTSPISDVQPQGLQLYIQHIRPRHIPLSLQTLYLFRQHRNVDLKTMQFAVGANPPDNVKRASFGLFAPHPEK